MRAYKRKRHETQHGKGYWLGIKISGYMGLTFVVFVIISKRMRL